jgi:hypothetical protein
MTFPKYRWLSIQLCIRSDDIEKKKAAKRMRSNVGIPGR